MYLFISGALVLSLEVYFGIEFLPAPFEFALIGLALVSLSKFIKRKYVNEFKNDHEG